MTFKLYKALGIMLLLIAGNTVLAQNPNSYAAQLPDSTAVQLTDTIRVQKIDTISAKNTRLALKTNLLYDAATVLNFAVEVPFNEKFSILYEHHCPWWLSRNNKYCLQFLGMGGEFRWWFAPKYIPQSEKRNERKVLSGHFLGVYGWGGKFDIQNRKDLCWQGEFISAGFTYGYALPIGKRLNMEFSISAGYAQIPYRHYIPTDDYQLLIKDIYKEGTFKYLGPTKVEVALVVPLAFKSKKGGNNEKHF